MKYPLNVSMFDRPEFTSDWWKGTVKRIEDAFADGLPEDFIQHPDFNAGQSGGLALAGREWAWLQETVDEHRLRTALSEHPFGHPNYVFNDDDIMTLLPQCSRSAIHYAYSLFLWEHETLSHIEEVGSVVEWGGGYGGLAAMFRRLNPEVRYTLIDLPIMAAIQDTYLYVTCGAQHESVPVGLADGVRAPELFISTWALSECTAEAHEFVADQGWFNRSVLLAHQPNHDWFPASNLLRSMASSHRIVPAATIGSEYLFR